MKFGPNFSDAPGIVACPPAIDHRCQRTMVRRGYVGDVLVQQIKLPFRHEVQDVLQAILFEQPNRQVRMNVSCNPCVRVDLVSPLVSGEHEHPDVEAASGLGRFGVPHCWCLVTAVEPRRNANALQ
eukprot:12926632-Alexandrium_andersonii.AAC.1